MFEYLATDGAGVRLAGAGDAVDRLSELVDDGASDGVHGGPPETEHLPKAAG